MYAACAITREATVPLGGKEEAKRLYCDGCYITSLDGTMPWKLRCVLL